MATEAIMDELDIGHTTDEGEGDDEERRVLKALIGRRMLRRRRVRRAILAHLLRERFGEDDDEDYEGADEEQRVLKALIGRRMLRRRRVRRAILAHLLRERFGEDDDDDDEYGFGEDGDDDEGHALRLLLGARLWRRRKARRAAWASLLKATA